MVAVAIRNAQQDDRGHFCELRNCKGRFALSKTTGQMQRNQQGLAGVMAGMASVFIALKPTLGFAQAISFDNGEASHTVGAEDQAWGDVTGSRARPHMSPLTEGCPSAKESD